MNLLKTALLIELALILGFGAGPAQAELLNSNSIRTVYYLLASPKGVGQSGFGHAYLRFSAQDAPTFNDVVVEYVASAPMKSWTDYLKAFGVGSMERLVKAEQYPTIVQEMNFSQGRDLISYQLLLTAAERAQIIERVNLALERGSDGSYRFFTRNCLSGIAEIFSQCGIVTKSGIASLLPYRYPELLAEAHRLKAIHVDSNIGTRREGLLEKYEASITPFVPDLAQLKGMLLSADWDERELGFARIANGARDSQGQIPTPVKNYLNAMAYLEPRVTRPGLKDTLQGAPSFEGSLLASRNFRFIPAHEGMTGRVGLRLLQQQVVHERDERFYLEVTLSVETPDGDIPKRVFAEKTIKFELSQLELDTEGRLLWNGRTVGMKASPRLFESSLILSDLSFRPRISPLAQNLWRIDIYLLTDHSVEKIRNIDSDASPLLVSLRNVDASRPSCAALADFQAAILKRLIFDEGAPPLPEEQSLSLIKDLLDGKNIVIPGYGDVRSWLASLDEMRLREVIYRYQRDVYEDLGSLFEKFWEVQHLSTEDLLEIGKMARLGYPSSVVQRVEGSRAHAILILDVLDEGNRLRLVAYDPNLGYVQDLFFFDKATERSDFTSYPREKLYFVSYDLKRETLTRPLLTPRISQQLVTFSRLSGQYSFRLQDLWRLY